MSIRGRRGFTILEAVIALAVVGLAGVSALEAMGAEIRAADHAAMAYTLAALAQDRLAVIASVSPRTLSALADTLARGTFPPPFDGYRWTTSVEPLFGAPDLYAVRIAISGARAEYAIETRLYRPVPAPSPLESR